MMSRSYYILLRMLIGAGIFLLCEWLGGQILKLTQKGLHGSWWEVIVTPIAFGCAYWLSDLVMPRVDTVIDLFSTELPDPAGEQIARLTGSVKLPTAITSSHGLEKAYRQVVTGHRKRAAP